ncbi:hypothetical protein D3D02_11690 [Halobellus sp. Atlit-38R]|uniref:DUF7562 family protein n=1 Tax=Halobellus sp. Atlit-38R TaxID=2282131 RepID=UPI000EF18DB0|nr:hypothetical protein [Halobellus sp. Atlit-38R]RLM88651.1 hypothetical protein D3D02_11690 [Halobellus sp. Atlit-38R]
MLTAPTVGKDGTDQQVTCIACGETVARDDAREYDKHGDRWSRKGKEFEYLCKPCHRKCCHQNRDGLEETLVAAGAGQTDQKTFLRQFCEQMSDGADPNWKKS